MVSQKIKRKNVNTMQLRSLRVSGPLAHPFGLPNIYVPVWFAVTNYGLHPKLYLYYSKSSLNIIHVFGYKIMVDKTDFKLTRIDSDGSKNP